MQSRTYHASRRVEFDSGVGMKMAPAVVSNTSDTIYGCLMKNSKQSSSG